MYEINYQWIIAIWVFFFLYTQIFSVNEYEGFDFAHFTTPQAQLTSTKLFCAAVTHEI